MDIIQLQDDIITRLRSVLPEHVYVLTAAELANVTVGTQSVPAVHVLYRGNSPVELSNSGRVAHIKHTWMFVVATASAAQLHGDNASRGEAFALETTMRRALMGWRPYRNSGFMALTKAEEGGNSHGFLYLISKFEITSTFDANLD